MSLFKMPVSALLATSGLLMPLAIAQTATAGPAIAFTYKYTQLNTNQCMRRSVRVLKNEGLLPPDNTINVNNTKFVIGEDSDITTIIDCSEVARSGRITVMVTRSTSPSIALDRANLLLNQVLRRQI